MAFFRNDTVNLLNMHYGIHALATAGGGAFFVAFLLRAAPETLSSRSWPMPAARWCRLSMFRP